MVVSIIVIWIIVIIILLLTIILILITNADIIANTVNTRKWKLISGWNDDMWGDFLLVLYVG